MFKSLLPWKHTKTKVMVPEQTMEDEQILEEPKLIPCSTCGRTFLSQPLKKHAPVCEKNASKKRKVFDSLKQRVEGTDLAQFHQKSYLKRQDSTPKTAEKPKRASHWEENHRKLVDAIRCAKGVPRDMSPAKPKVQAASSTQLNERCPHCDRQFGPKAFDRHVEWCKEHQTRIQKSPANILLAKERLEARTKYKVPPLTKPKRTTIKEKYSNPTVSRTESVCSVKSTPTNAFRRNASVRKPKSVLDLGKKNNALNKADEKANSVVTLNEMKKNTEQSKSTTAPYDPFVSAERQFMELLECDAFKPLTSPTKPHLRPHTAANNSVKLPAKKFVKSAGAPAPKRASVIDPPACFQDPDAADDDFEILENLINDQFNNDEFFLTLNKHNKDEFNVILNQRKYSDDMSSVDSNLINENDNLSIPEHFKFGNYSTESSEDTDTTLQNDVDVYSLQYDLKIEPPANKGNATKVSKTKSKLNSSFGSGDAAQKKVVKTTVGYDKRGKELKSKVNKPQLKPKTQVIEPHEPDQTIKPEDLFAVDDKMYAEYKIFEEMYLKEKEQMSNTRKQRSKNSIKSYGIEIVNEDYTNQNSNKVSGDSAYGSLNRSSPKAKTTKLSPLQRQRIDSASSSGSENFVPPVQNNHRMSKFCHECGNKYPVTTAKFCPECGVKRLLL
ncbi:uncharacterized protein LOC135133350 isoform X5 [Zophobas morio]|uniref:uncharacterized protein LOC135133350 isoform X5 n=1 Tax=Zophobas morio TaxID=2755281 RepID=UPI0030838E1D